MISSPFLLQKYRPRAWAHGHLCVIYFFVVEPNPPSRTPSAASSSVIPKRQKNALGKAVAGGYRGAVTRIVRGAAHFDHNVPLVGGAVIIGVNNTNGIIPADPGA